MSKTGFLSFGRAGSARYSLSVSLLLIAPLACLLIFAFFYPLSRLVVQSFFAPEFTLEEYARLVREPLFLGILLKTLRTALYCTALAFALGFPVSLLLARLRGFWKLVLLGCVLIPLWTSALARAYAWVVLLQRRGLVNDILLGSGILDQPARLLYTEGAVVVAMAHVLLPFMILPIHSALAAQPPDYVRAARSLGAGSIKAFLYVTLPLSLPGVFAGCLMVFILALGFYVIPAIVGGSSVLFISTLIGQQMTVQLNWRLAGALCTVLLAVTLVLTVVFRRFLVIGQSRV